MSKLYYTAPSDEIFNEVKSKAILLWTEKYPEETSPYYAKEKVLRIENIGNVEDNLMYIVAMFDSENMRHLARMISMEASIAIGDRMVDGGGGSYPFLSSN